MPTALDGSNYAVTSPEFAIKLQKREREYLFASQYNTNVQK